MSYSKFFCLRCNNANSACKCTTTDLHFSYSHKLRVPPIDNKVKFRQFLDDCPYFVNCVAEWQRPFFLDLLREVKYFNKSINGFKWTNISK